MSLDGDWKIVVKSPIGDQPATVSLKTEGSVVTGSSVAQGATVAIADGKIDGDTVTWSAQVTSPMPMKMEFTGKLAGDTLNGSVKAGAFGSFPFTGARA